MKELLFYFIVLGFFVTAVLGMLASWLDRKVTARVQWRVGPPWYQPFADFVKLLGKETIIPEGGSKLLYLSLPIFGLVSVIIVSTSLWIISINPDRGFIGDLIVIIYLLTIPSLSVIIGAIMSRNPYASVGASREIKLILSYELPFILAMIVAIMRTGFTIRLGEIMLYQTVNTGVVGSLSGILALVVAIFCMQAKLCLVPFDAPEAETEIMAGAYIEYSGTMLAIYKLTKAMLLFVLPALLVAVFWGGFIPVSGMVLVKGLLKYVVLLVLIILIRNTSPRVKIGQAVKFFWGPMTLLALLAVLLAWLGY